MLADIAEPLAELVKAVGPGIKVLGDAQRTVRQLPRAVARELLDDSVLAAILKWVQEKFVGKGKEEDRNKLLQEVFDAARTLPIAQPQAPERFDPAQQVGPPLFFGR